MELRSILCWGDNNQIRRHKPDAAAHIFIINEEVNDQTRRKDHMADDDVFWTRAKAKVRLPVAVLILEQMILREARGMEISPQEGGNN